MTSEARCSKCFQRLEAGAKFCGKCGSAVEQDTGRPAPRYSGGGIECPSCRHENLASARFCERCGTQLQAMPAPASAETEQRSYRPEPFDYRSTEPAQEDPWATGPGYDRPPSEEDTCPRCGSFRNPDETTCLNCGLPFGQSTNYAGVPVAVAHVGKPAGFWIRLVSAIIDGIIVTIITSPLIVIAARTDSSAVESLMSWAQFGIGTLYGTILLGLYGTTPGKRVFNIYVLDESGNKKLGLGRAFVREISKIVSGFILLIGYIMVAFRADKRALHDLIAGTFPTVVHRRY